MAQDSFGSLSEFFKSQLHLNDAQFGTLISIGLLPNVVLVFVSGIFTDRIGYNRAVVIFSFFVCLGSFIVYISKDFYLTALGRFFLGASVRSKLDYQFVFSANFNSSEREKNEPGFPFDCSNCCAYNMVQKQQ